MSNCARIDGANVCIDTMFFCFVLYKQANTKTMNPRSLLSLAKRRGSRHLKTKINGRAWNGRGKHVICKQELVDHMKHNYGLSLPSNANKLSHVALMSLIDGIIYIQRSHRQRRRKWDNAICPFTQSPPEEPVYIRVNSLGYRRAFTLESLANYLLLTGKAKDPIDGEPFSSEALCAIDRACIVAKISLPGLVSAITSDEKKLEFKRNRDDDAFISELEEHMNVAVYNMCFDIQNFEGDIQFMLQSDYRSFYDIKRHAESYNRIRPVAIWIDIAINNLPDHLEHPEELAYAHAYLWRLKRQCQDVQVVPQPELPLGAFDDDDDIYEDADDNPNDEDIDYNDQNGIDPHEHLEPLVEALRSLGRFAPLRFIREPPAYNNSSPTPSSIERFMEEMFFGVSSLFFSGIPRTSDTN